MSYVEVFGGVLLFCFGLFVLLAGLFAGYFGAGKSRRTGAGLAILGAVLLVIFAGITWGGVPLLEAYRVDGTLIAQGLLAVVAAALGGLLAFGLFLASIMRA